MVKQQEGGGLKGGDGGGTIEDFGGGSKGFGGDWGQVDDLRRELQLATDERYVCTSLESTSLESTSLESTSLFEPRVLVLLQPVTNK